MAAEEPLLLSTLPQLRDFVINLPTSLSLPQSFEEPLLLSTPPQLRDFVINLPTSPSLPQTFDTNSNPHDESEEEDDYVPSPPPSSAWSGKKIQRSKTAPAMTLMKDYRSHDISDPNFKSDTSSLVRKAAVLLILYLSLGIVIYSFNRDYFSVAETHPVVDALYFSIVTMCTIGYGDIAPTTTIAKIFACGFVLVGFGVVNYVLDLQENIILAGVKAAPQQQQQKKNVGLALGVVVMCIGIGILFLYFVERLNWVDSFYLSVMSVTTVGYGGGAFKTVSGRLFASVWLLFSTLAVVRAFQYLAEARVDKRQRKIANWALHRDITVEDFVAADINNGGFICKSEYVIYKLKEMGKIKEKDVVQICDQFNKLDRNNSGKITLSDLLQSRQ